MSEDDSRRPADSEEKPAEKPHRSWLERISAALSGEPTSREDLVELLRDPARRARLGAAAAVVARERHSAEAYRRTLLTAYGTLEVRT